MLKVEVIQVGKSVGIPLPKEVLDGLKVKKGDMLCLIETADGYRLRSYDEAFAEPLEVAESVVDRYRNALKELAK